jgi:ribosomal protein S4
MSTHKTKPKLKKYKMAGLAKKTNDYRINFFLPEHTYLTHHLKKLEHTFSNSLNNKRQIKLLFGFNQTYKLFNLIKDIDKKNTHDWSRQKRFSKTNGLINLIEHRLDVVLLRANFASTLSQARQLISHRQILVNGTVVTSSFFVLEKRDVISVFPTIRKIVKQNIKQRIQKRSSIVSQYNSFEISYTIQKIVIISDSLKTYKFFNLNKQELNLLFAKCLKG